MARVFHLKNGDGMFDEVSMGYLLPDMHLISEIQEIDPNYTDTGQKFVFKVYLKNGLDIEFGYKTHKEAFEARRDVILDMMRYWGPDQMIFANNFKLEITIVAAVMTVTDIFEKEYSSSFSLLIKDVPYPINLIFPDKQAATMARQSILEKQESYLCHVKNNEPIAVNQ